MLSYFCHNVQRDRRLKEEIKKCKETNRSLNDFFSTREVLDIFFYHLDGVELLINLNPLQ
jgi:hypothetical protein